MPFFGWTADMPLVGTYALKMLQYWANPFASTVLKRTGEQFFLLDGSPSQVPLLVRNASHHLSPYAANPACCT